MGKLCQCLGSFLAQFAISTLDATISPSVAWESAKNGITFLVSKRKRPKKCHLWPAIKKTANGLAPNANKATYLMQKYAHELITTSLSVFEQKTEMKENVVFSTNNVLPLFHSVSYHIHTIIELYLRYSRRKSIAMRSEFI